MNNENVEIVRPFARMMADEMSIEDIDSMSKKGAFITFRSGTGLTDMPDIP